MDEGAAIVNTAAEMTPVFTEQHVRRLGPLRRFLVRRPRTMDAALALCFAGWALVTGVGADSMYALHAYLGDDRVVQMQAVSLVLTVVGAVALYWRRSRPIAVTALMTGLGVVAIATTGAVSGFELGVAIGLYAVAAFRPSIVAWAACALAVVAPVLSARLLPLSNAVGAIMLGVDDAADVQNIVLYQNAGPIIAVALLAVAFGSSARSRRLHIARFVDAANSVAREEESRTKLVRAEERSRIAREMHDVVAHSLTVMVALGGGASVSLKRAPDQAQLALDELVATGRAALEDMRRVLGVLDELPSGAEAESAPAATEPAPGSSDVAALIDRFRMAGLQIRFASVADPLHNADPGLQLAVYRIVQESLTNVLRHAPGTRTVEVDIRGMTDFLEVMVTDHGATGRVHAASSSQRGLIGMRERAALFRGTVDAAPHDDGWRVRVELPWPGAVTR